MKNHKLPFKNAVAAILIATILVSGGTALAVLYYSHIHESQSIDPAFVLKYIDQKGDLPSHYIEEILDLCVDKQVNIHDFSTSAAKDELLNHPLIQSAEVKKSMPDACQVVYTLFEPVALLSDWENAALDDGGRMIPFHPFYRKVGLPIITIGEVKDAAWGKKLKRARVHLALNIIKSLPLQEIIRLDVSQVDLPSFGQREIIITTQNAILRLDPDNWEKGWSHFLKMSNVLRTSSKYIIDLRIPRIALIDRKA